MALISLKCPSCGANISLDNDNEYGFCSYCGSKIQNDAIQRLKIEYKGDPMSVTNEYKNTNTNYNNTFNVNNFEATKPNMIISKPKVFKLIFGIFLFGIAIALFPITIKQKNIAMGWIMIAVFGAGGVALIVGYFKSLSLYSKAIKYAIMNNSVTNRKK